jgi:hypothetical protein
MKRNGEDEEYDGFVKSEEKSIEELLGVGGLESLREEERKIESTRGLLDETLNYLYKEYNVKGLRHFRRRVSKCKTFDELRVAADCLLTIGKFHESES